MKAAYGGEVVYFKGTGDPYAATLTKAYANGLPGVDRAFDIASNGTESFSVLAPVVKYDVLTPCTGTMTVSRSSSGATRRRCPDRLIRQSERHGPACSGRGFVMSE
jgi:hypothetical protein